VHLAGFLSDWGQCFLNFLIHGHADLTKKAVELLDGKDAEINFPYLL
jgi:hypothetical protein